MIRSTLADSLLNFLDCCSRRSPTDAPASSVEVPSGNLAMSHEVTIGGRTATKAKLDLLLFFLSGGINKSFQSESWPSTAGFNDDGRTDGRSSIGLELFGRMIYTTENFRTRNGL